MLSGYWMQRSSGQAQAQGRTLRSSIPDPALQLDFEPVATLMIGSPVSSEWQYEGRACVGYRWGCRWERCWLLGDRPRGKWHARQLQQPQHCSHSTVPTALRPQHCSLSTAASSALHPQHCTLSILTTAASLPLQPQLSSTCAAALVQVP